jgi:glutathione S-transferase
MRAVFEGERGGEGKAPAGAAIGQEDAVGVVADELAAGVFVVGEAAWPERGMEFYDGYVGPARKARNQRHADVEPALVWCWEQQAGEHWPDPLSSVRLTRWTDKRGPATDRYTIADIALYAYTHVAGDGGFDLSGYSAIGRWLDRVAAQPGHVSITA